MRIIRLFSIRIGLYRVLYSTQYTVYSIQSTVYSIQYTTHNTHTLTTASVGILRSWNMATPLVASARESSCGVVTMMAPVKVRD